VKCDSLKNDQPLETLWRDYSLP